MVNIEDGTALRFRLLQGLSAQVAVFTATVQIPTQFSYIKCTAGSPNSTVPCTFAAAGTEGAQIPTFRDGPRGEGEVVAVDIGFPPGTVPANEKIDYRWTVGAAFSAQPLPLGLALGLLVLGGIGLFALHRRAGADANAGGPDQPRRRVRADRRRAERVPGRGRHPARAMSARWPTSGSTRSTSPPPWSTSPYAAT